MKRLPTIMSSIRIFFLCCLLGHFSSQALFSQTETPEATPTPAPTPTPIDPELQRLRDRNAILEEQKKAQDLEKAINDSKLPKPTTTPLAGNTEIDAGVKIETEMMAYSALKMTAEKVAEELKKNRNDATILAILNNQWLNGIKSYWATKNQMNLIAEGYNRILVPPLAMPNLIAGRSEIGIVKDILGQQGETVAIKDKEPLDLTFKSSNFNVNLIGSDKSSDTTDGPPFGSFTAVGSLFGVMGSVAGAFVDLAALARTDTKITGSSFAVQESALVSEVYRGLKTNLSGFAKLYYPSEFSPNINARKEFAILKDIQQLYETKSRAEQIVGEVEEVDKAYKEALTAKAGLEARKKQLPDLIAAAGRELKKNEGIYKTPKFQSAELKAKIEDNKNTLADLKKEKDIGLPKKIESNLSAITALDLKLTRLYEQIKSVTPTIDLVGAYAATGANLDDVSDNLLGRPYKVEELEKLATGDESTQKALTKEASARAASMNGDLSPRDKDTLINPIDPDRLRSFLKVTGEVRNRPDHFNQAVLNDLLTEGEQLRLYYREGEQVEVAKKIFERSKVSAVNSLKVLNKQFDNFFAEIVKVDPAAGMNPITSHLQTENLLDALECDMKTGACKKANALVVRVVDVGGNNKVKKNLVTMIATGDSVSHSGGAIIEYKLYDLHGNVLTSSVCSAYAPYRNARNINASSVPAMQAVCSPVPANASGNGNGDAKFGEKAAVTKGRRRMQ